MRKRAALWLFACLWVMAASCGRQANEEPVGPWPEPPAMPTEAVLMYWAYSQDPPVDEAVFIAADGQVTYLDRANQREGQQFVGPEGVAYFLDGLRAAGFDGLEATYAPEKGAKALGGHVAVALRQGDDVKQVRWQEPAQPQALAQMAGELAQFMEVVRASAR